MRGENMRFAVFGLLVLTAGCQVVTPEGLRANAQFHGTYESADNYETIYKRVIERSESDRMGSFWASDSLLIRYAIFPESREAHVYREDADFFDRGVAVWVIDIQSAGSGSQIRAYAKNEYLWGQVDKRLRGLGASPVDR